MGAYTATSNKCKIAREPRAKGRNTGDSEKQRNLNRIEGRKDGLVASSKIEKTQEGEEDTVSSADTDGNYQYFLEQDEN